MFYNKGLAIPRYYTKVYYIIKDCLDCGDDLTFFILTYKGGLTYITINLLPTYLVLEETFKDC